MYKLIVSVKLAQLLSMTPCLARCHVPLPRLVFTARVTGKRTKSQPFCDSDNRICNSSRGQVPLAYGSALCSAYKPRVHLTSSLLPALTCQLFTTYQAVTSSLVKAAPDKRLIQGRQKDRGELQPFMGR